MKKEYALCGKFTTPHEPYLWLAACLWATTKQREDVHPSLTQAAHLQEAVQHQIRAGLSTPSYFIWLDADENTHRERVRLDVTRSRKHLDENLRLLPSCL
jgi:hypothetical protein